MRRSGGVCAEVLSPDVHASTAMFIQKQQNNKTTYLNNPTLNSLLSLRP